jgi:hypothetical protein
MEEEVKFHAFVTFALNSDEWSVSFFGGLFVKNK